MKKKALVIAPGRGTYNKEELGYLGKYHADKLEFITKIDDYRRTQDQIPISELDGREAYSIKEHTRGDNASPLIYACSYGDYLSIDREKFDIVAITGNSMGWYIAMACAGALTEDHAIKLINTMGTMMQDSLIGGQMIYPFVDENWKFIAGKREVLLGIMEEINGEPDCELYVSIELGGMIVFGGNDRALDQLQSRLEPVQASFPLRLPNHAAFHTPMQKPNLEQACKMIQRNFFQKPDVPLIDGCGHIWSRYSSDLQEIYDYTLQTQVCETYDFTRSVQVGMKEFSPDCVIVLGPGTTLGGAVAQSLIGIGWEELSGKDNFIERQNSDNPILYAMGIVSQREKVV